MAWYLIVSIPDPCCLSYFKSIRAGTWKHVKSQSIGLNLMIVGFLCSVILVQRHQHGGNLMYTVVCNDKSTCSLKK